jgi:hypothetical protein
MKSKISTINVAQKLAKTISSRDVLLELVKFIKVAKEKKVSLDFAQVEFISRSAAHELLMIRADFERKRLFKKQIEFINLNDDVKNMIRTVAANLASPRGTKPTVKAETIDIYSLVDNFS